MLRLVCLLACLWLPAIGNAADRVALVIGNSDYKALPDLTHAQDDASAIAGVLRDIGYDVLRVRNADQGAMLQAMNPFMQASKVVTLFFVGHATSHRGRVYLLPTDALAESGDAAISGIDLTDMLAQLEATGAEASVAMLDLSDPFASAARGLGVSGSALSRHLQNLSLPERTTILASTVAGDPASLAAQAKRNRNHSALVEEILFQSGRADRPTDAFAEAASRYLNERVNAAEQVLARSSQDSDVSFGIALAMSEPMASPVPVAEPSPVPQAEVAASPPITDVKPVATAVAKPKPKPRPAPKPATAEPPVQRAIALGKRRAATKKTPDRGWSVAGSTPTPEFPWPPPQPSATVLLPLEAIQASAKGQAVGDVMTFVEGVLNDQGYHDRSYWSVPGGAALATRLERIDRDGQPITRPTRWPTSKLEADFSIGAYLKSLFYTEPGFFRVIVFVLSTEAIAPTEREATSDEALDWLRRGMVTLPKEIAEREVETTHNLTALIYEFEKVPDSEAIVLSPGRLTGREHLESAGLMALAVQ